MVNQKNIDQLNLIKTKLQQAKSVVLADYRGLSVPLIQDLRQKIKTVGGELMVTKNTLLKLALSAEKYPFPPDIEEILTGPTITLFAYEDEIAPIKTLAEFAQDNQLPKIKAGFLSQAPLSAEKINQLAQLPGKTELLAQTVSAIKAPLSGFVQVLSGNLTNLVYILEAIKKDKNN